MEKTLLKGLIIGVVVVAISSVVGKHIPMLKI